MTSSAVQNIFGHIVVINLATRPDRMETFYPSMAEAGIERADIDRFNAVATPGRGWLGCARSHIAVIEMAKEKGWDRVTVLEDDFYFLDPKHAVRKLEQGIVKEGLKFDVFMLAASYLLGSELNPRSHDVIRLNRGTTTSGYIVNKHYYDTLLGNFRECEAVMKYVTTLHQYFYTNSADALDQHWRALQIRDNWYTFRKPPGCQRDGYSDIEGCDKKTPYSTL